jgi:hypothetical protein
MVSVGIKVLLFASDRKKLGKEKKEIGMGCEIHAEVKH